MTELYHVITYTPLDHAAAIREAIANAGGGHLGAYDHCSFAMRGTGRFRPLEHAKPHIGEAGGGVEEVEEERLEVVVTQENLKPVLQAIRKVHPYEEPAIIVTVMVDTNP